MEVDLNEQVTEMKQIANGLGIPFAHLHAEVEGKSKKASFETLPPDSSSEPGRARLPSTPSSPQDVEPEPAIPDEQNNDGDVVCGIASLAKSLMALLFCIVIRKRPYGIRGLQFETPVWEFFNALRRSRGKSLIERMLLKPSIVID